MDRSHRGTIFIEEAQVLEHQSFEGNQRILSLEAKKLAAAAGPGVFAHLQCDSSLPMRRPMSVMLTDPEQGWVQVLYKVVGKGTALLSEKRPGDKLSVMGPIGRPFQPLPDRSRPLLIGGGVGIPPMVFLAAHIRANLPDASPMVLMGSEVPFPFEARPSQILVPGIPDGVIAGMPLMEDWNIASRLASGVGFAGCYDGYVTDLARQWLDQLSAEELAQVAIYACGPTPMLRAAATVAAEYGLPSQVSLEEYMACAVGGCAGCVVRVKDGNGFAMRRVCVDGPVFDGATVVWC